MPTPPPRKRIRTTQESKRLETYVTENGLKAVSVYIPVELHKALHEVAIQGEMSLQGLITLACNTYYGVHRDLPPLVAPTRIKTDPHKNVTWYADVDLHKRIKLIALDIDGTVQQLVLSALVDYCKGSKAVKALKIKTGHAAYARAPSIMPSPG